MVGGTTFHRRVIQREISRVLVLNPLSRKHGARNTDGRTLSLTPPSLLSRGTHCVGDAGEIKSLGHPPVEPTLVEPTLNVSH